MSAVTILEEVCWTMTSFIQLQLNVMDAEQGAERLCLCFSTTIPSSEAPESI